MPKVSQEASKHHPKIMENRALTPPKIEAKRLLNGLQKQVRIQSRSRRAPCQSFRAIFSNFEASWLPRWTHVGGQDAPIINKKNDAKKHEILKASWKAIISENLRFWKATWKQVGTKIDAEIDVIFERWFFEKTLFFLRKNLLF